MRERYIPPLIMLIAGAITSILNIVNKVELVSGLKRLLVVIIIFYIIGLITKAIVIMALTKFAKKEPTEETMEDNEQPGGNNS